MEIEIFKVLFFFHPPTIQNIQIFSMVFQSLNMVFAFISIYTVFYLFIYLFNVIIHQNKHKGN